MSKKLFELEEQLNHMIDELVEHKTNILKALGGEANERPKYHQWELVLAYIKAHGSITALDAIMELGIIDLAGRIRDLRHRGYPIVSTPEACKNRWGDKVHYVRYTINA